MLHKKIHALYAFLVYKKKITWLKIKTNLQYTYFRPERKIFGRDYTQKSPFKIYKWIPPEREASNANH